MDGGRRTDSPETAAQLRSPPPPQKNNTPPQISSDPPPPSRVHHPKMHYTVDGRRARGALGALLLITA
ncbi:MAG: hypothetical protein RIF41_31895, partial [Polyangiaceae bacterium]